MNFIAATVVLKSLLPDPVSAYGISYRAADALPIYCGPMTPKNETFVRLVRGERAAVARFDCTAFPIPQYKERTASLYELQARSKQGLL